MLRCHLTSGLGKLEILADTVALSPLTADSSATAWSGNINTSSVMLSS